MRKLCLAFTTLAALGIGSVASASVIENVDLTFKSGATFAGHVTFANDFSCYSAVSGTLTDYKYGQNGFAGSGSDSINWVWGAGGNGNGCGAGANASTAGANSYQNWLMDGTYVGNYSNWITFGYHYSSSGIQLFGGGVGGLYGSSVNNVDYTDPLVSGTVRVPEPATLALFGLGLGALGLTFRRRKAV